MTEKKMIIILLIFCQMGAMLWYFSKSAEKKEKGSLWGCVKGFARKQLMSLANDGFIGKKYEKILNDRKKLLENELFDSCITLKNLAVVQWDKPFSADFAYGILMDNSEKLKPVYGEMISLYRNGRDIEAFNVVSKAIATRNAANFAVILSKLDKINPAELIEQMEVLQEMMAEERMTKAIKRAQRNGIISTVCATATIFALFINFTVVVVFMDTLQMLKTIF